MEKEEAIPEAGTLRTDDGAEAAAGSHGEGKGGGIMDHLISNLVFSPSSSESGRIDELKAEDSSDERNMGEVGGELFANMISNIHNEEQKKEEMVKDVVEEDEKPKENGREGIINNIVNNLPTSLPDDAAPTTTDEAAILIHSIVHE